MVTRSTCPQHGQVCSLEKYSSRTADWSDLEIGQTDHASAKNSYPGDETLNAAYVISQR